MTLIPPDCYPVSVRLSGQGCFSAECLLQSRLYGIKVVEIVSPAEPDVANYLYDSLSPRDKREVHRYSKKVSLGYY
jgi:hypothetical protein